MTRPLIPLRPIAVCGYGGAAATPHILSTQAAMATLARGGNAVDAAIAANAMQGVVAPETCGVGGDLFALVTGSGWATPRCLDSSGRAGHGANAEALRDQALTSIPQRHPAAITVPGCVDGWLALSEAHGSLRLGDALEPAIAAATNGFPASSELVVALSYRREELMEEAAAADLFIEGQPPLEGRRLRRPDLAATLTAVAERGRAGFYEGAIGEAISAATDGWLTDGDLANPQAEWVEPLGIPLFGLTAWTTPPSSQGYISLLALAICERLGIGEPDDPRTWHVAVEAYRLAAADRDIVLADRSWMSIESGSLLETGRVDRLAAGFDPRSVRALAGPAPAAGGTAYMCVVDAEGVGVSLIQSNFHGIGSGRSAGSAGFLLHDRGRGFTLEKGHPNELAPGKRPLHTLSPTLWTEGERLATTLGTRGGHQQPQLVSQLALGVAGHRLDPAMAMACPRWHMEPPTPVSTTSALALEPGTPAPVVEELSRVGHEVEVLSYPQAGWGPMSLITVDEAGRRVACADPRVDTASAAAT